MGYITQAEDMRNALIGKPEGKNKLARPKSRLDGSIKKGIKETGRGGVSSIHLVQDRYQWHAIVNTVTNFLVL